MSHESYPTATPPPPKNCPYGWYKYLNKCYKYFDQPIDWLEAKDYCECHHPSATLAQPKSYYELLSICYVIPISNGQSASAWIGISDIVVEGR